MDDRIIATLPQQLIGSCRCLRLRIYLKTSQVTPKDSEGHFQIFSLSSPEACPVSGLPG